MRKIDRLRHEALQSCKARGHVMGRFIRVGTWSYCWCKVCNAWVAIDPEPAPNSIDISGSAVAINCGDKP